MLQTWGSDFLPQEWRHASLINLLWRWLSLEAALWRGAQEQLRDFPTLTKPDAMFELANTCTFPPFPLLNEAAVKGWSSKKYIGMGWQHVIILLATDSVFRNCPNTFLYISRKCSTKGLQTQIWPVVSRINFKKVMSQFLVFLKDQLVFINIVKKKYMCFHSSYLSFPPPPTVDGFD